MEVFRIWPAGEVLFLDAAGPQETSERAGAMGAPVGRHRLSAPGGLRMRRFIRIQLWLRSLFRRNRVETETAEEFQFHLERLTEENRAAGMPLPEGRDAARRTLGGIPQLTEECRDARGTRWIENFFQDLRYGIRLMGKSPGFSAAAVPTLAIGMAAATNIFSIVYGV